MSDSNSMLAKRSNLGYGLAIPVTIHGVVHHFAGDGAGLESNLPNWFRHCSWSFDWASAVQLVNV